MIYTRFAQILLLRNELEGAADSTCKLMRRKSAIYSVRDFVVKSDDGRKGKKRSSINNLSRCLISGSLLEKELLDPVYPLYVNLEVNLQYPHQLEGCILMAKDMEESEKFTKEQCCEAYARVFSSFMCKNQLYDLDFTNMHRNPLYMFVTSSTAHAVQLFCNFYQDLSQHLADQKSLLSDEELLYLTQSCEEAMCYFLRTKFPPKEGYKRYHALTRNSQDRFQRVLGWLSKSFERPGSSLPRPSSCPLVPNQNGENRLVVDYGPLLRRVGCLDELVATDSKPAPHAQLDFDAAAQANTVTEENAEESADAHEGKGRHEQIVDIYSGEEALPTQQEEEEEDEDNAGDERPVDDSDGEQEDDVDDAHAEREDVFTEMPNRQHQEQVEDGYVKAGEDIDVEDNIEQGHLETLDDQDVEAGIDEQDSGEVDPNGKFDYQQDPERTVDEDRPEEEEVEQEGNLSDYNESQQEQLEEDVIMPTRNNINREQGESFEASDSLQMLENYRAVSTEQEGEVNDGYHMTALDTNEEFFDASQGGDISRQNRGEEEDEGEFFEAQEFGKDGEVYNDTGGDHACVGAMSKGDKQTVEPGAGEGGQDTEDPQCNQHDEDFEGFYASDVVAGETEHVGHDEREKENETEDDREESTYGGAGNEGEQEAIVDAKVIEVEPMETSEVERGETNVSVEANSVDDATSLPRQKLMRDDEQIREDKPSLGLGPPLQGDSGGRGGGDFLHTDAPAHVASPPSDSPRSRGTERRRSPCQESEPKEDVRMAASLDDDGLSESVKSCGQVDENSTAERKGSSHSRDDQDGGDKDVDEGYAAEEEDYNFAPHKSSGVGPSYDSASQEDTSSLVASQKDTTLLQVADTAHHPQILVNSEEAASGAAVAEVPLDFAYDATGEESQGQTEEEEDHHKGRGMAISDVISTNVARLPAVAHEPSVDGYDAEESQGHTEEDEERPSEKARSAEVETERSNAFDEQKGPTGKSLNIGDGYDATAEEESQGHTEDEEDRPSGDLPVSLDAQGCTLDDQQDQRPTVERHVEFAPSREVASTKVDEGYDPDDAQDHTEDEVPQNRVDGYQGGESSLDQTEDEGVPTDIEDEEAKLQPDQNRSNETHRAQDGFVQQDAQSISGMSAADDHPTGKHDVESSEQEEVVEKKRVQSGPGSFQQPRSKLQDYAAAAQQRFAATEQQLTPEKNLPRNSEDGRGPIPSEYRSPESEQKANISIEEPVKVATKVESVVGDAIMVETFVGSDQRNNDTREGVEMDVERAGVEDQEETEGVKVDVTHSTPNCSFELEARSPRTTMSGSGDMDIDSLPNARDEIEEVSCSKMAVELGYDSLLQTRETGQPTGSVDAEVSNPAPSSVDVPVVTNKVDTAFMSSTNTAMDCDDHNSSKLDEDTDHARQGDVTPPSDSPSNKALSLRFEQESDVHPEVRSQHVDDKNTADGLAKPLLESRSSEDVQKVDTIKISDGDEVAPAAEMRSNERVGRIDDRSRANGDEFEPVNDCITSDGNGVKPTSENPPNEDVGEVENKNNADGNEAEPAAPTVDVGNLDDKNNTDGDGAELAAESRAPGDVEELEDSSTAGGKEVAVGNLDDKNSADGDGAEPAAESWPAEDVEELEDSNTAGGNEVDVGNLDDKNNADGDGAEPAARESRLPDDVEELEDRNRAGGKEVDAGNLDDKNNADGDGGELAAESRAPGAIEELEGSNTADGKEVDVGNLDDKNNADGDGAEPAARESRLPDDVEELEDSNTAGGKEVDVGNLDDKNNADGDGGELAAESRAPGDVEELEDSSTAGGKEVDVGNLDDKNNADGDGAEPAARESRLPDAEAGGKGKSKNSRIATQLAERRWMLETSTIRTTLMELARSWQRKVGLLEMSKNSRIATQLAERRWMLETSTIRTTLIEMGRSWRQGKVDLLKMSKNWRIGTELAERRWMLETSTTRTALMEMGPSRQRKVGLLKMSKNLRIATQPVEMRWMLETSTIRTTLMEMGLSRRQGKVGFLTMSKNSRIATQLAERRWMLETSTIRTTLMEMAGSWQLKVGLLELSKNSTIAAQLAERRWMLETSTIRTALMEMGQSRRQGKVGFLTMSKNSRIATQLVERKWMLETSTIRTALMDMGPSRQRKVGLLKMSKNLRIATQPVERRWMLETSTIRTTLMEMARSWQRKVGLLEKSKNSRIATQLAERKWMLETSTIRTTLMEMARSWQRKVGLLEMSKNSRIAAQLVERRWMLETSMIRTALMEMAWSWQRKVGQLNMSKNSTITAQLTEMMAT